MASEERFFLYHNSGSCNYGDHDVQFSSFATLEEAEARIKEILQVTFDHSPAWSIVKGVLVEEKE